MKSIAILLTMFTAAFAQTPVFQTAISPAGQSEAVFSISEWGRYSIEAESSEGVALQLIDRKSGLRAQDGVVGEQNGRIDAFFDFGEYKTIAQAHQKGTAAARLKVYSFLERNRGNPRYLTPLREYTDTLDDRQQLSYWIHLANDTTIFFEVLGRNVADVQLWQNGQWRIDSKRIAISSNPSPETPLQGFRLVQKLNAGYYRLTIYGGPGAQWSKSSDRHPVYFRWELPRFPASGIGSYAISPAGYNQFIVSASAYAFVLSAPDKKKRLLLSALAFSGGPSFSGARTDSIHAQSANPSCLVTPYNAAGAYIVRVTGEPGTPFSLQSLERIRTRLAVDTSGEYWLSTLHTGFPQDQLGVSGGLVDLHTSTAIHSRVDTVDAKRRIRRTFNLLDGVSLFFFAGEGGKYEFMPGGAAMKVTVRRFLLDARLRALGTFDKKSTLLLEKGLYVVNISPVKKGIAQLEIKKSSLISMAKEMAGFGADTVKRAPNLQFPSVRLLEGRKYHLFVNSLAPERAGMILRRLPLDITEPLPVFVRPAQAVPIQITLPEEANVSITDRNGRHYRYLLDGKLAQSPKTVGRGEYSLMLSSDTMACLIVRAVPVSRLPRAEPRPFPTGDESPLRIFPEIRPAKTEYLNLDRNDFSVYELTVDKPGIYRFETTGRLHTSLTLRDRFVVRMCEKSANGVGRNALIQAYLLPGRYQAVVSTRGRSAGRLGLRLQASDLIDGGELSIGREQRRRIPAGAGVICRVPITEEASYRILSQGQSGYFSCRFDDAEGWPVVKPGRKADITRKLAAGEYRLISLPENRKTLRITRLEQSEEAKEYSGKGPHVLILNKPAHSVWFEDSAKGVRQPARFTLELQAPVRCRLSCTRGFEASLVGEAIELQWSGITDTLLPMGAYAIAVMAHKAQNSAEYHLSATTAMLAPGLSYPMSPHSAKREYTVSVGQKTVIELFSQGMRDIAAGLYTKGSDSLIAFNDDGHNDWNFKISRVLEPGLYTLLVESRGASEGQSEIVMSSLIDTVHKNWPLNTERELHLTGKIHTIPVTTTDSADVINIAVYGGSRVGAIIERGQNRSYTALGEREGDTLSLSAAIHSAGSYRVRVWSADHLDERVTVSVNTARFQQVSIKELLGGVTVEKTPTGSLTSAWLQVHMGDDSLNHYHIDSDGLFPHVRSAAQRDRVFERDFEQYISSLGKSLFVECQFAGARRRRVKATPVVLDSAFTAPVTHAPRAFSRQISNGRITVFQARMKNGIPMCGVETAGEADFHPGGIPVWSGAFRGGRHAACAALPGDSHRFLVWNADAQSSKTRNPVSVEAREFEIGRLQPLTFGDVEWTPSAPGAMGYSFKKRTPALIRLIIPASGLAVWRRPDGSRVTWAARKDLQAIVVREREGSLYCINCEGDGYFHVECIAMDEHADSLFVPFALAPKARPFEHHFARAGTQRIALDCLLKDLADATLFYQGAIANIDWWTGSGLYVRGLASSRPFPFDKLPAHAPNAPAGFLDCSHDAGWSAVSVSPQNSPVVWWGPDLEPRKKKKVTHSRVVNLASGANWFVVPVDKPVHVQIATDASAAGILLRNREPVRSFLGLEGFSADMPLGRGVYTFGIRGVGNTDLRRAALTVSFKPVHELTEKNPPRVRLASGENRMLRFTLREKKKIGIGLATNREVWQARLYSETFALLGEGQQQFRYLDKGTYYLWLSIPHNQEPAECVVKLVGQEVPPDKPPEEVIRRFIKQ